MELLDRLIEKWFSLGFGAKPPSKTILGVDISSSAIKLIEMEPSRDGFIVIAYGVEPLPEGVTFDREIIDVAKNCPSPPFSIQEIWRTVSKCSRGGVRIFNYQ